MACNGNSLADAYKQIEELKSQLRAVKADNASLCRAIEDRDDDRTKLKVLLRGVVDMHKETCDTVDEIIVPKTGQAIPRGLEIIAMCEEALK